MSDKYIYKRRIIMFGYMFGFISAVVVSVFFPVTYAKFVTYVRSFWNKVKDAEENTPVN